MDAPENTNWFYDYGIEDIHVVDAIFSAHSPGLPRPGDAVNATPDAGVEIDGSFGESERETSSRKRTRNDTRVPSKACREKQRRDKLNDRFIELAALLDPGKPPKTDKSAILVDAVRVIIQLKADAEKQKNSNLNILEKIKELKAEKNELREEKQKLKAEKEKLEKQLKTMSGSPSNFMPAAFAAQNQAACDKLVPVISYPSVAMWQFMPPAAVDTSQDHALRPPVA